MIIIIILRTYLTKRRKSSQDVNAIPVIEEQFSISKKTVTENVKVEKMDYCN
jgi:stress response protein YsnF